MREVMRSVQNERGVAIPIVLLILGVAGLIAAGLLVQSRLDNYFTIAQVTNDRMFNLADGAASLAYTQLGLKESVNYQGGYSTQTIEAKDVTNVGYYSARATLKGYETDPTALAGYELGTGEGYHVQYWVAEGMGRTSVSLRASQPSNQPLPETMVLIGASKFSRNL
jgi:hypothetical protein